MLMYLDISHTFEGNCQRGFPAVFFFNSGGSNNNLCNFLTSRTTGYTEVPNPMSKVSIWKHCLHLKYNITRIWFSEVRYYCEIYATTICTQRSREHTQEHTHIGQEKACHTD